MNTVEQAYGRHRYDRRIDGLRLTVTGHRPGQSTPRHAHGFGCLHYVLSGVYVEQAEGELVACGRGELLTKPPDLVHANRLGPSGAVSLRVEGHGVPIGGSSLEGSSIKAGLRTELSGSTSLGISLEELAQAILAERSDRELSQAVRWFLECLSQPQPTPAYDLPVEVQAATMLRSEPTVRRSVNEIARTIGTHRSHLSRQFRRRYHCTLPQFANRQRSLWVARRLFRRREPLAQIALWAGFYDQSHCIRSFRELFGAPPLRWWALGWSD